MKDLIFTVFIGENMVNGQHKSEIAIENVMAIVYPDFLIPHGQITLDGKLYLQQTNCFWSIEQLATYFCDWFDIIEDKNRIVADIHLNILSLHKTFRGEDIPKILNIIDKYPNFQMLRTFDFYGIKGE